MNNNLQIFNSSDFGEIRTAVKDGEPYFCLADVCKALDISNSHNVKSRLTIKGVATMDTLTKGGMQSIVFISEPNLYKVIFQSRKPEAEKFADWVTSEVLPSIRKHGAYATPTTIDNIIADPSNAIKLLQALNDEREKSQSLETELIKSSRVIETMKPKVSYYDKILKNPSLMNTTVIAQDYGMSARGFNKKLHDLHIQYKIGKQWILYAEYLDKGYVHSETFEVEG